MPLSHPRSRENLLSFPSLLSLNFLTLLLQVTHSPHPTPQHPLPCPKPLPPWPTSPSCGTNIFFFFSFSNLVHSLPTQVARPYEVRLLGGPTWHSGLIPFQPPGSYLSLRSGGEKRGEKAAWGGLISMGLVQKTRDSAILVMLQLLQICSRYKRRELELSKQSITLTLKHLFSRLALLFSPFFISTSQPPPSTLPLWRSIASSLSHRTLSFASIILTSSSLIDVLKHDVFYSFLWFFFFLFLLWLLVWGAIEYICIYLYTSISFCLFLFLIIFATRFSSVFWFVCFFPEGADWPESASTSTLSLFAQSKCPSFVFCFFAFFFSSQLLLAQPETSRWQGLRHTCRH